MPPKIEMIGRVFNMLTVLSEHAAIAGKRPHYLCRCECGATPVVSGDAMRRGNTKSCGCHRKAVAAKNSFKHGFVGTKTYGVWESVKKRCLDEKNRSYPNYGGRGITMCESWKGDFSAFLRDMGETPAGCVIDRIDNDKSYVPGNCRWITQKANCRNKSNNIYLSLGEETRLLVEWAEVFGVSEVLLRKRRARGLSEEQIFFGLTKVAI